MTEGDESRWTGIPAAGGEPGLQRRLQAFGNFTPPDRVGVPSYKALAGAQDNPALGATDHCRLSLVKQPFLELGGNFVAPRGSCGLAIFRARFGFVQEEVAIGVVAEGRAEDFVDDLLGK